MAVKIRPAHHALLCYAEWCADNRRPWPGMKRVAYDLARDISDMRTALAEMEAWGLISKRHHGNGQTVIIRLGDGRETAPFPVHVIHSSVDVRLSSPQSRGNEKPRRARAG